MNVQPSDPPVNLRRAVESDAEAIARLTDELGYPSNADAIRARVRAVSASPADLLLVSTNSAAEPVGWLQAHAAHLVESGYRVEILRLVVSAGYRRRGHARALISEAEKWARSIGAVAVVVRSNLKRVESHAFYPACGYESVKTQQVYRKAIDT
jgi:GNAT superfamily N-acetyltransferase